MGNLIAGKELWTPDQLRMLREGWARGFTIKHISFVTGRTESAVKKKRKELGLPVRRPGGQLKGLRFNVDEKLYWEIRKRARERNQGVASYLRMLVTRDVGLNP